MQRLAIVFVAVLIATHTRSQNDIDALRYSAMGTGGTSRFLATGGAFGALGADVSCSSYNPAGLALFRKGEITFSGGLRLTTNNADLYGKRTRIGDASFVFNNFGLAVAWESKLDAESRHVIGFTNNQLQNYFSSTRMTAYTNNSSIAKDMLILAREDGNVNYLSNSYEGLAFDTYLLDTINGEFISMVDTKRTVKQTRDLLTSGRMNELNFSYAYSYKDKYYLGASLGVPRVSYESSTIHTEVDDRDSTRITFTSTGTYTHTYTDGMPVVHGEYLSRGGFNSLTYTEYFETIGTGFNLKLGGIARVNDALRLGFYYHTPTIFNLTDAYYNEMSATFDLKPNSPDVKRYPSQGGVYNYRVITPSRLGLNAGAVIGKSAIIGLDYEFVNYGKAQISGETLDDFAGVNSVIARKYTVGHNIRLGGEYNFQPLMVRAGYNMQGSPFGHVLFGDFVRHTVSLGAGFRMKNNLYFDFAWMRSFSTEKYYLFTALDAMSRINYNSSQLSVTAGIKF